MWAYLRTEETFESLSGSWYAKVTILANTGEEQCVFLTFPQDPTDTQVKAEVTILVANMNADAALAPLEHFPRIRESF